MEDKMKVLVEQMGFSRTEAKMALEDCNNDLRTEVGNLLSGKYAPPSYQGPPPIYEEASSSQVPTSSNNIYPTLESNRKENSNIASSNSPGLFSKLFYHNNAPPQESSNTDPTAPGLDRLANSKPPDLEIESQPPPYEKYDKNEKIRSWEKDSNVFHFDSRDSIITAAKEDVRLPSTQRDVDDARCDICYSILFPKNEDSFSQATSPEVIQHQGKVFTLSFLIDVHS